MGYGYSQNFYLNNERKTLENFISVCVFESLFLMSVKILLLLFTSLNDPASGYFLATEMHDQTDIDNSAVFEWLNIAQVLKRTGYKKEKKEKKTKQKKAMPDKSKFPNVCLLHQAVDFVDVGSCLL